MSKCPFWSTSSKKIVCNNECPMHNSIMEETDCIFKEFLSLESITFKDIIDEDFTYSQDKLLNFDYIKDSSSY
ncbi:MAG: hypothetical protein GX275_07350 [Clostridiales bacterium]|nr:hypothetical protein [Clostridiales bacterium]